MSKKKIIIPIVVAAIVACGVGYCSYNITKASTVSENSISSNTSTNTNKTTANTQSTNNTNTINTNNTNATTADTQTKNSSLSSKVTNKEASSTQTNKIAYVYDKVVNGDVPVFGIPGVQKSFKNALQSGTQITILGSETSNGYYKIEYGNNQIAYISANNVTFNKIPLSQLKQEFLNQLNEINNNVPVTSEYTTQQMVNYEANSYSKWTMELETICIAIQNNMTTTQKNNFMTEQNQWANENLKPIVSSEKNSRESYINTTKKLISLTKDRCYYLVNTYM